MAKKQKSYVGFRSLLAYSDNLFAPTLRGENAICVWFPGSGRSTFLRESLKSKVVLRKTFGSLLSNLKVVFINCEFGKWNRLVIDEFGVADEAGLKKMLEKKVRFGGEFLFVVDSPDGLPKEEFGKLLVFLSDLNAISPHRVHVSLHIVNKPLFDEIVLEKTFLSSLAQNVIYVPVLSGEFLDECLDGYEKFFGSPLPSPRKKEIVTSIGGLLRLVKEKFRLSNSETEFDLKLRAVWQKVPGLYQRIILRQIRKEKLVGGSEIAAAAVLKKMGVLGLEIFKQKYPLLVSDPWRAFENGATEKDMKVIAVLQSASGLVSKEVLATAIWGEQTDFSDWAVDQFVSRLRKKLAKNGIDPEIIRTSKGKGYQWKD